MKTKLTIYGIMTALVAVYLFFETPNLNPFFTEGAIFWSIIISVYAGAAIIMKYGKLSLKGETGTQMPFNYVPIKKVPMKIKILIAIPWIYVVIMTIGSSFIFNWTAYRDQLGESETKTFSSDVQAVDIAQIPIVDKDLAYNLAGKKLGERQSLGSQVVLGEPTIQRVKDKLVWAVPLHHSGFFKWITNLEGTPGYVLVSATNVNDVEYVDGYRIKYMPYNYLMQDLTRHIRFGGAFFDGITDYSFELDDNGQPYWAVSTYKNLRGFNLPEATGIILVNASTGEQQKYTIANIPEWVDRVQPEEFVVNQINNQGEFIKGFLNFANKDKFKASKGEAIVYNNGKCYLFTGLTSVGTDDSAIGFIMVDMVTKESIRYQMSGATENVAQSSAMGKVQQMRYNASFPIIINLNGQATYFMTLKDNAGLVKQYAMVSVEKFSIVGTGETVSDTIIDYERALSNNSSTADIGQVVEKTSANGKVIRIASEISAGEAIYKLIIEGHEDKIFIAPSKISNELALTQIGDDVEIEYAQTKSPVVSVVNFDNMQFTQRKIEE